MPHITTRVAKPGGLRQGKHITDAARPRGVCRD
jgi:hypothetical protein